MLAYAHGVNKTRIGEKIIISDVDERVEAYLPPHLPPYPVLNLVELGTKLEKANLAIGRLDGIAIILPDIPIFLYMYVRLEALLSSQIEGTLSSLSDLLLFEVERELGVPLDDVQEVSNYIAAMNHGLERIKNGFPLSQRLIKEIHQVLLSKGRGSKMLPGEYRRSQNWIGGERPGKAQYVPPPHGYLSDLMSDLEKFIHKDYSSIPNLVRAGMIHVQFETIHPFLDGNGRLGRLLITLYLCSSGLLRHPCLYLSLFFKKHQSHYYELLQRVRTHGDWESWLEFFLDGVIETSIHATVTTQEMLRLFDKDYEQIQQLGRMAASALRVHRILQERPMITGTYAAKNSSISLPTAYSAIQHLEQLGIVREITGKKSQRVFLYEKYWEILTRETEPAL